MVIFDLDGTLWDSAVSVADSWNIEIKRVKGRDKGLVADDIRRNMGKTMNEIADDLFTEYQEEERYELARYCEKFENEYITVHGGELFPGVEETLALLKDHGVRMSIVSNCQEGYVKAFLESMDMYRFFEDYEEWGRSGFLKAENIRLMMERNGIKEAIYVGDIQKDADASAKAGIPCIWAAFGFGHIEDPAAAIDSFDALPAALKELGFLDH